MKKLIDVLEKLKIDDIRIDKFPINGTIEDVIEFLKEQGFEDIKQRGPKDNVFNSKESKCFTYIEELKRVWFADTSKKTISKENPIFVVKFFKDIKEVSSYEYNVYYLINKNVEFIVRNDKKEFLEELNKRFSWQ